MNSDKFKSPNKIAIPAIDSVRGKYHGLTFHLYSTKSFGYTTLTRIILNKEIVHITKTNTVILSYRYIL